MGKNIEKHTVIVDGMSCGHCKNAVENAVGILPGLLFAEVDLGAKSLIVEFDASKITLQEIKEVVVEEGYNVI